MPKAVRWVEPTPKTATDHGDPVTLYVENHVDNGARVALTENMAGAVVICQDAINAFIPGFWGRSVGSKYKVQLMLVNNEVTVLKKGGY